MVRHYIKLIIAHTLPPKAGRKLIVFFKPSYNRLSEFVRRSYFNFVHRRYQRIAKRLQKKEKLKVAFFILSETEWKCEGLYRLMEQSDRFEPVIIICPYLVYGEEIMKRDLEKAYSAFKSKGYNVLTTLHSASGKWMNVKKEINPDLVVFTVPYYKQTRNDYYITNFLDRLTFYIAYGFCQENRNAFHFNLLMHNLVFRYFMETPFHVSLAKATATNKGINAVAVGFPGLDELLFPCSTADHNDSWKVSNPELKRVIWAPHHTIEQEVSVFNYSNFLNYAQFMLDVADRYREQIQFTFKPHPILKPKLYEHPLWGKQLTDDYYNSWKSFSNTQINESEYNNLFLTSDAMITDSGSFMIEYLCTNKPSLYLVRDSNIRDRFTSFGKEGFECHYHGFQKDDVIDFLEMAVLQGKDPLLNKRSGWVTNSIMPPNGKTASENMFDNICQTLKIK